MKITRLKKPPPPRPPRGQYLHIWGTVRANPATWFRVEAPDKRQAHSLAVAARLQGFFAREEGRDVLITAR